MAELALRQESPLVAAKQLQQSNAQPAVAGVKLGEQPLLGYLNLRGQGDGFADAVQQSIGLMLPTTANTLSENDDHALCWLGPDEWLLMVPSGEQDALASQLQTSLQAQQPALHYAVTDTSSGLCTISISGQYARAVLAKGCPLDLHPRVFAVGQCAQTVLAKAGVLLCPRADDSLHIIVRRSFADYLWRWLVDAAEEYGVAVI